MKRIITGITAFLAFFTVSSIVKADFIAETFVSDQSFITSLAFAPNGTFMFIEKSTGTVKIVLGQDSVRTAPFFDFNVNDVGERGGLGLTFHPQYPDSPYVYSYVTISQSGISNIIVRLVDSLGYGTNPDTIFRAPVTSGASNHNGGNLHFGPDGKLYVTIGDNAVSQWAQDTCRVQGKIIRLNYDGSIPDDNPISCAPIFAYGLRNSYDFCFHPITGIIYASENGPAANDEVNRILPGLNYGWPVIQCSSGDSDFENALICWTPTNAPTGILVPHNSLIPEFNGKLLMTDWNDANLHSMTLNAGGDSVLSDDIVYTGPFGLVDIEQGLDGMFYLSSGNGSIIRLRPNIIPHAPTIDFHLPSENNLDIPIGDLEFAVSATDQDNDPLSFNWLKNGQSVSNDSITTIAFSEPGNYDILAIVSDSQLADSVFWNVNVHTTGGNPPQPFPLIRPSDGERIVTLNTHFTWGIAEDWDLNSSVDYMVQIADDTLFNGDESSFNANADTSLSLSTTILESISNSLFYRVLAIDNDSLITIGGIPSPEVRDFQIIPPGDTNGSGVANGLDVVFLDSRSGVGNQRAEDCRTNLVASRLTRPDGGRDRLRFSPA